MVKKKLSSTQERVKLFIFIIEIKPYEITNRNWTTTKLRLNLYYIKLRIYTKSELIQHKNLNCYFVNWNLKDLSNWDIIKKKIELM